MAGSITWEIASSNPGFLGIAENVLASGLVTPTYAATGTQHVQGFDEFTADFDIPALTIGPGRYYLVLHAGPLSDAHSSPFDGFYWEASSANGLLEHLVRTSPFSPGWGHAGFNLAMEFFSPAATPPTTSGTVPEPGMLSLFGLGVVAMLRGARGSAARRKD